MGMRHVVMFRWNDGLGDEHTQRVMAGLAELPGKIPEIRDYRFGPDLGINAGTYDFVVVADFDDVDDYLTYRDHPDHQRFIADTITGNVAERAAVQFRTS